MHAEARAFIKRHATIHRLDVVEFGSRNVNGQIRDLFPNSWFTGVDITAGEGVDIVIDAARYEHPQPCDLVVCAEVLEHAPNWQAIVDNAYRILRPGGVFIVTCAGPGREPHSAVDGGKVRDGEYYANVSTGQLSGAMWRAGFDMVRTNQVGTDTQGLGYRAVDP